MASYDGLTTKGNMTTADTMTDKQINAAIAKACDIVGKDKYGPIYKTPDGWVVDCPRFATDLNAMHEAQRALTKAQTDEYIAVLFDSTHEATLATARQRAEAFLRALGKWEEATDKDSLTVGATTEESSVDQKEVQP
jgi:hypothetical protein